MNKKDFISNLEDQLKVSSIVSSNVKEIVEDYKIMIDDALENGEEEQTVLNRLGRPSDIARTLSRHESKEKRSKSKFVALSPFIATIIFFVLGMYFDLWSISWMAFLLIPIAGLVTSHKHNLSILLPTIIFFILGFGYDLWHPGWLIFLSVPTLSDLFEGNSSIAKTIEGLSFFLIITAYMLIGFYYNIWHPTWVLFFLIPLFGVINERNSEKTMIALVAYLIIPLIYVYLEYINYSNYNYLIFIFTILGSINLKNISITLESKKDRMMVGYISIITILYIIFGLTYSIWHPTWLIFLTIPMFAMITFEKNIQFVAFTPFISVIIFFIWGHYFDGYHMAWLVFLLIPMAGILSDQ